MIIPVLLLIAFGFFMCLAAYQAAKLKVPTPPEDQESGTESS